MKKSYQMNSLLTRATKTNYQFDVTDESGQTVTVITGAQAINYLGNRYGEYMFYSQYDDNKTVADNILNARNNFESLLVDFKTINGDNINRMYRALRAEYNPIENYNRFEVGRITDEHHKGTKHAYAENTVDTPAVTTTIEYTPQVRTTVTDTPNTTTTRDVSTYGYNSDVATPTDKTTESNTGTATSTSEQSGTNTQTQKQQGNNSRVRSASENYETISDISDSEYDNDVRTFDGYNIHGNIGVSTSQSMVNDEIALRMRPQIYNILDDFMRTWTYYVSGEDVVCYD